MSKKVKLLSICKPKQYKTISKNELVEDGKYLVYGANGVIGKSNKYTHENPTLMVTCRGATCGSLNISKPFSYINGNAMAFDSIDKNFDLMYLYYFLSSRGFNDAISGTAQPQITRENLKNIDVLELSLEKQKQIAKTLDKVNELIELRKESITKLDALAKSIFIDMFGDPVSNPRGWEVKELNDICEITSSKRVYKSDYVSEGIPFYKIKEIILKSKNIEPEEIEYISKDAFENFASKFGYPQKGDILVTAVGATIGYFYLVDDEKFYFKDGNLIWLRNYKIDINKKFLLYMFQTKEFKNKILGLSKGAAQDALTIIKLKSVFICMPPIDIQNKFAKIIEKIEEQKSLYEKELKKLEENFQALLQKSFQE